MYVQPQIRRPWRCGCSDRFVRDSSYLGQTGRVPHKSSRRAARPLLLCRLSWSGVKFAYLWRGPDVLRCQMWHHTRTVAGQNAPSLLPSSHGRRRPRDPRRAEHGRHGGRRRRLPTGQCHRRGHRATSHAPPRPPNPPLRFRFRFRCGLTLPRGASLLAGPLGGGGYAGSQFGTSSK